MKDGRPRAAAVRAWAAALLDHFHVTPDVLARLTRRQIQELYFHKRTKEGAVEAPAQEVGPEEKAGTLEEELRNLDILAGMLRLKPEDVEASREELRAKFGAAGDEA